MLHEYVVGDPLRFVDLSLLTLVVQVARHFMERHEFDYSTVVKRLVDFGFLFDRLDELGSLLQVLTVVALVGSSQRFEAVVLAASDVHHLVNLCVVAISYLADDPEMVVDRLRSFVRAKLSSRLLLT